MTTFILIVSIIFGVDCVLAEKSEFAVTTEFSESRTDLEDRLLANVIRAENSSQLISDKNNEEELKKADKKARTAHRESNLDSRDKSIFWKFFSLNYKEVLLNDNNLDYKEVLLN